MPGEFDFIQWVCAQQKPDGVALLTAGDDLAVLRWPSNDLILVGVDQVLDGVHFDSGAHSPRAIGRKAMNRNLSDCAAMGCLPAIAVMTVAAHKGTGLVFLQELYSGMREAAEVHGCQIVGGDTGSWEGRLVVTVTILGRDGGISPVTRRGAKFGDGIYVTGPLGGSILGRHMTFQPRIAEGRRIAEAGATSMIDLSDGLSRDLPHICESSGVGAMLDTAAIPIHADAVTLASRDQISALEHAMNDGEDYELLYTCRPGVTDLPGVLIGTIIEKPGVFMSQAGRSDLLIPKGWEHSL